MDGKIILGIVGVISSAIVGIYGLMYKHATRGNKHPCADDIMPRGECASERKRLEDCIENVLKLTTMEYKNLSKNVDAGFKRLEGLIKNGQRGN